MFKLDMDAIRKGAKQPWLMANAANVANLANKEAKNPVPLATLATLAALAISHEVISPDKSLLAARLLATALQVCDRNGDDPEAREAMRLDCLAIPENQKAELLEHLRSTIPHEKVARAPPPVDPRPRKVQPDESWRVLDAAYLVHHFACKTCCTAGQGRGLRCGTGTALWRAYESSAMTPTGVARKKGTL